MNPCAPAAHNRVADSIHADMSVVIAANSEDRRQLTERADQIAKLAQFRRPVYQVATQGQNIYLGSARGFDYLPTEMIGTRPPKMYIAHIHQAARIMPYRQALFADVKGSAKSDRQRSRRQFCSL